MRFFLSLFLHQRAIDGVVDLVAEGIDLSMSSRNVLIRDMDISNYEKLRQDAENYYKKVGKTFCPAFKEFVYFNAEGFNHLVYKGDRTERSKEIQVLKFNLLGNARKLVEMATTFQEYDEEIREVVVKKFKRKERESRVFKYWGLIAIMGTWKIKVIIRQIGNGQKHFWSVIPNWTTNKYRDLKLLNRMKGNPAED